MSSKNRTSKKTVEYFYDDDGKLIRTEEVEQVIVTDISHGGCGGSGGWWNDSVGTGTGIR